MLHSENSLRTPPTPNRRSVVHEKHGRIPFDILKQRSEAFMVHDEPVVI